MEHLPYHGGSQDMERSHLYAAPGTVRGTYAD